MPEGYCHHGRYSTGGPDYCRRCAQEAVDAREAKNEQAAEEASDRKTQSRIAAALERIAAALEGTD